MAHEETVEISLRDQNKKYYELIATNIKKC